MDIRIKNTTDAKSDALVILNGEDKFASLILTMKTIKTSIEGNWSDCVAKTSAIKKLNECINYYETKIIPALKKLGTSIDAYAIATEQLASARVGGGTANGVVSPVSHVMNEDITPAQYADSQRTVNFSKEKYDQLGGGDALYDGSYSKEEFREMVEKYGSTLGNHIIEGGYMPVREAFEKNVLPYSDVFYDEATKYGLDPAFVMGIACQESGHGSSWNVINKSNLFGMGAFDSNPSNAYKYDGPGASIAHVCQNIGENYVALDGKWHTGSDISQIGSIYASDPNWANSVDWLAGKIKSCVE